MPGRGAPKPSAKAAWFEQAGAVVFRRTGEAIQVLVISSRRTEGRWIFPKGHLDPGESPDEGALREAQEEAGVVGRVIRPLSPVVEYRYGSADYRVRYFLVEWLGDTEPDEDRECHWLAPDRAMALLSDEDTRALLRVALADIERQGR